MSEPIKLMAFETVEQFIRRHPGGVFTNDVANRFAMRVSDVRRTLKRLEKRGLISSKRETAGGHGNFAGAGLVWTGTVPGDAAPRSALCPYCKASVAVHCISEKEARRCIDWTRSLSSQDGKGAA